MKTLIAITFLWVGGLLACLTAAGQTTAFSHVTHPTITGSNTNTVNVGSLTCATNGQTVNVSRRYLDLILDLGDYYPVGGTNWSYSINATITGFNSLNVPILAPVNATLTINEGGTVKPEVRSLYRVDYTSLTSTISYFTINWSTPTSAPAAGLHENYARVRAVWTNEVGYDHHDCSSNEIQATSLRFRGLRTGSSGPYTEIELDWDLPSGKYFDKYDLEILKLEPYYKQSLGKVYIDWSKAARVEVANGETNYKFTPAKGTGYYVWRVRPVGTYYAKDRADRRNLGDWNTISGAHNNSELTSHHFTWSGDYQVNASGTATNVITGNWSTGSKDVFYYTQFDENLNWVFSRTYTGGGKQHEQMAWANGLEHIYQSQVRQNSKSEVIGDQTVYDYSGRGSLQSLPAPVGDERFSYKRDFFNNLSGDPYSAADFDTDAKLYDPTKMSVADASPSRYYSDHTVGGMKDIYVGHSDSLPFNRTLFLPDATGRTWKMAGVGEVFKLEETGTAGVNHNTIFQYGSVAQVELDRIFGNEAPLYKTTYKTQATDPNGVKTVTYYSKKGNVLATVLNNDIQLTNMDQVGSNDIFPVTYVLDEGVVNQSGYYTETSMSLLIDAPPVSPFTKDVTLDYTLSPKTFGLDCDASCSNCDICWECDYMVEIAIQEPQFAQDPNKNITLRFWVTPDVLFTCGGGNPPSLGLDDIIGNYTYEFEKPDGTITMSPVSHFADLLTTQEVHLLSGSYMITKKVYVNTINTATGNPYLTDHQNELIAQSESWTADENCCGPFTIDVSGFDCDDIEDIDCSDAPAIANLATELHALLAQEHNSILSDNTTNYTSMLTIPAANLTSFQYLNNYSSFESLITTLICDEQIPSSVIYSCFQVYAGVLTQNIAYADLTQQGNNGNLTGPNNPAVQMNDHFDFLAAVFNCIGYNPIPGCEQYKDLVFLAYDWNGVPVHSQEEINAATAAQNDPNFKYYVVWDACHLPPGQSLDPNSMFFNPALMGIHQPFYPGQVKLIEIPCNPMQGQPSNLLSLNQNCWDIYSWPSALVSGMSEQEGRMQLAEQFCECTDTAVVAVNTTPPTPPVPPLQSTVQTCEQNCQDKALAFEIAINNYVNSYNASNGIFDDQVDGGGNSIWEAYNPMLFDEWQDVATLFNGNDLECMIDLMIAQCLQQCQMDLSQLAETLPTGGHCDNCTPPHMPWGPGCFNGNTYIPGSGAFNCWQDFVQSPMFIDSVATEQYEFEQAMLWNALAAPVDNTPLQYSDFGSLDVIQDELIEFFYNSIDEGLLLRPVVNVLPQATTDYRVDYFGNMAMGYTYRQKTLNMSYQANGNTYDIVAVTNVIIDQPTTNQDEDTIRQMNIAVYCEDHDNSNNSVAVPIMYWAYSPDISVDMCLAFIGMSPLGYHIEHQVVDLSFDAAGVFHAVMNPQACKYDQANSVLWSPSICKNEWTASAQVNITGGGVGDYVMIEAIPLGNSGNFHYLLNSSVAWTGSNAATAQAVADAINNETTTPNYTASATSNTVTIYAPDNGAMSPLIYDLATSGGATMSVVNAGNPFSLCADSLAQSIAAAGCGTLTDTYSRECPYGYQKLHTTTMYSGTNPLSNPTGLINQLTGFWTQALDNIIIGRAINPNPIYTEFGVAPGGTTGWVYYEESQDFLIDGMWYTAIANVVGNECVVTSGNQSGVRKEILRINLLLVCKDNPSTVIADLHIGCRINPSQVNDPCYPYAGLFSYESLTIDPFSNNNLAQYTSAIPFFFNSIGLHDEANDGDYDFILFDVNFTSALRDPSSPIYTGWSCGWNPSAWATGNVAVYDAPIDTTDWLNDNDGLLWKLDANGQKDLFDGNDPCGVNTQVCEICMRWEEPENYEVENAVEELTCEDIMQGYIENQTSILLENCLFNKQAELDSAYKEVCLNQIEDELKVVYNLNYGGYTLFYYDRAQNLIQSVPPEGVNPLDAAGLALVAAHRSSPGSNPAYFPNHDFETDYTQNSIHELIAEETKDGGRKVLWHNALSQLILSQDPAQAAVGYGRYNYSRYDKLGRLVESGEFGVNNGVSSANLQEELWDNLYFPYTSSSLSTLSPLIQASSQKDVVHHEYTNLASVTYDGQSQQNLRNRISRSYTDDGYTTYYSYDIHGNVKWMVQELPEIGQKTIEYDYDLQGGNISLISFNKKKEDQYFHKYTYDEDDNMVGVFTSRDGVLWDRDAQYDFSNMGDLERSEIGQDLLQGLDYTYTTTGELKGINQVELLSDGQRDPGMDGAYVGTLTIGAGSGSQTSGSIKIGGTTIVSGITWNDDAVSTADDIVSAINTSYKGNPSGYKFRADNEGGTSATITIYSPGLGGALSVTGNTIPISGLNGFALAGFIKDEFALELGYYDGDFQRTSSFIGGKSGVASTTHYPYLSNLGGGDVTAAANDLYNGNISHTVSNTRSGQAGSGSIDGKSIRLNLYRYDQWNRLRKTDFRAFVSGNYWTAVQEGGLTSADPRYDEYYTYDLNSNITTLKRYGGLAGTRNATTFLMDDLEYNYEILSGEKTNRLKHISEGETAYTTDLGVQLNDPNYLYDAEGKLIADASEGISISWNALDKISRISKQTGESIIYEYDPMGNRVMKKNLDAGGNFTTVTYYVLDMAGNLLSTYQKEYIAGNTTMKQKELPLYGLGRLGVKHEEVQVGSTVPGYHEYNTPALPGNIAINYPVVRKLTDKQYELTDHTQSVRATFSDHRLAVAGGSVTDYNLDVGSWVDYFSGGFPQPGRSYNNTYRYGYQGSERDDDIAGVANGHFSTFFREGDTRVMRWWSMDPAKHRMPDFSPYSYMDANPVANIDPRGDFIIVDDLVLGFISGLFKKKERGKTRMGMAFSGAGNRAKHSLQIYAGLFRSDPSRGILFRGWQIISRFSWELPQTVAGLLWYQTVNTFAGGHITDVYNFHGSTGIDWKSKRGRGWGFTIGSWFMMSSPSLERHEFGHTVVSRRQGWAFIPLNLWSLFTARSHNHHNMPWEKWADRAGRKYIRKHGGPRSHRKKHKLKKKKTKVGKGRQRVKHKKSRGNGKVKRGGKKRRRRGPKRWYGRKGGRVRF